MTAATVRPHVSVALTLLAADRPREARPLLEEAVDTVRASDRWLGARARVALAGIVVDEDPERARRLVEEARRVLSPELPLHRELLRRIERLAARSG